MEGNHSEIKEKLYKLARFTKVSDMKWIGDPYKFRKKAVNPRTLHIAQTITVHVETFALRDRVYLQRNDTDVEPRVLKAKTLLFFVHIIFQKLVNFSPADPVPGHEDHAPRLFFEWGSAKYGTADFLRHNLTTALQTGRH